MLSYTNLIVTKSLFIVDKAAATFSGVGKIKSFKDKVLICHWIIFHIFTMTERETIEETCDMFLQL